MITELFPEEKRRLFDLEQQLLELERGNVSIQPVNVLMSINEMTTRLENLERLAANESKTRRDDYRRRIMHLKNSHAHIKSSLELFMKTNDKRNNYDFQRQQLFEGSSGSEYTDIEMAENSSLKRSNKAINEYIANSQESLTELYSQRERLKVVHKKVLDIMNYLGLSTSIMRVVEKRESIDAWLVMIGMIGISGLLIYIICYMKR